MRRPRRLSSLLRLARAHPRKLRGGLTGTFAWALLPVFLGCGEPNPLERRAVHGVVTYQGKPVDYGAITFLPDDPQHGVNSGAMIEGGKSSNYALTKRMMYNEPDTWNLLMSKFSDLPMDFADASLVALAERLRLSRIFTVDLADFSIYRRHGNKVIPVLMPD